VAGRARPIGFCNPYFDQFTPLDDILQAGSLVDAFDPRPRTSSTRSSASAPGAASGPTC
jgi:hypothetical protein